MVTAKGNSRLRRGVTALTANEQLMDAVLRHQTYLMRYAGYVRNRMLQLLNESELDVANIIKSVLPQGAAALSTSNEWKRYERLTGKIANLRRGVWSKANDELKREALALVAAEPVAMQRIIATVSPVQFNIRLPSAAQLRTIALSRPFEGRLLREWAATMADNDVRRIANSIKLGMTAGETSGQIAQRVIGTAEAQGANGITQLSRNEVSTISRTAIMYIANAAKQAFLYENSDIIVGEQFVATLDSHTTITCASLDGKVFKIGQGPQPPLHYNCRSTRIAAFDERIGDRPANPTTERMLIEEFTDKHGLSGITVRDELPRGTKTAFDAYARKRIRELVGPVPANINYQTFLSRQGVQYQNEILGVARGQLFREGGLTLDRFVDRNYNPIPLAELAKREAAAFEAAGLKNFS